MPMSTDEEVRERIIERIIELLHELTERQLELVTEFLDDLVNIPLLRTDTAGLERAKRIDRERRETEAADRRWTNEGGAASGEGVERPHERP
jgi:hypothetical protein